jgi:hypothetical protein
MATRFSRARARQLAREVLRDWERRPRDEVEALCGNGRAPSIEQRVDDETGVAYMETVAAVHERESGELILTVVISRVPTSRLSAFASIPVGASKRLHR